jgi:hypothetical protein
MASVLVKARELIIAEASGLKYLQKCYLFYNISIAVIVIHIISKGLYFFFFIYAMLSKGGERIIFFFI